MNGAAYDLLATWSGLIGVGKLLRELAAGRTWTKHCRTYARTVGSLSPG
jgi:hypothetical protein